MKRLLFLSVVPFLFSCSDNKGHSIDIKSEADIAGLRVATVAGTIYDLELSTRDDITLTLFNSESDLLQALINDKADVIVHDEVVYNARVRRENGVKIACVGKQSFPTAFMFRKEDKELAQAMTDVQRRMEEDGSMKRLKDFWLSDLYDQADTYTHIPDETSGTPLRIAAATNSAPLSFLIEKDWYGLEMDMLRELGKQLHRPLEIRHYTAGSSILAVKTELADILCGGVFVTPERQEEFLFSEPYHDFHPAYFVMDRESGIPINKQHVSFMERLRKNFVTEKRWKFLLKGINNTLKISILAILLGSILGAGLYAMSRSRRRWMRSFAKSYSIILSGIPELVLLLILFYVVFADTVVPPEIVAVISFAMFFASGAKDIYGTSLESIPKGQTEAGLALGFTRAQTFFHIVLPQAIRRGLPLYKDRCISLLKGTSIVGYIAIQDITRAGDIIRNRTFDALIPLAVITLIYFLLIQLFGTLLMLATPKKNVL